MEHVVFFPAHDGTPAFRRVAALEDAVRLVEHLRNVEGVNEVSVHALAEVPLSFRTVIKVELPPVAEPAREPAAEARVEPVEAPVEAVGSPSVVEVPAPVLTAVASEQPVAPVAPATPEQAAAPAAEQVETAVVSARRQGARSLGFFS